MKSIPDRCSGLKIVELIRTESLNYGDWGGYKGATEQQLGSLWGATPKNSSARQLYIRLNAQPSSKFRELKDFNNFSLNFTTGSQELDLTFGEHLASSLGRPRALPKCTEVDNECLGSLRLR